MKQDETRNPDGTFKKGVSGNPAGRPQGAVSITEMVRRELLEVEPKTKKTWGELVLRRILLKATNEGDTTMLKAIWSYIDGMPKQSLEVEGTIQHNVIGLPNKRNLDTPPQTDSSTREK